MNQEIGLFTVYHSRGSAQRKAHPRTDGDAKKDPGSPKIRLLQMETTQQILKPRLRTEARPNRVDPQSPCTPSQKGRGPARYL